MEKRKNSASSGIAVFLVVALLCVGAFFVARSIVQKRSGAMGQAIATPAYADQTVKALGGGILYYDGSALHALNEQGRQIWNYAVGVDAGFSVDSGGVAAWSGTMLSLLTSEEGLTQFSGSMEGEILAARMGTVYSAVQTGEEHNSVMLVLDASGRQVDRIELKNQTLLDFGFFNNDALLWVMSLDTEGTTPMCSISTYRPGKMLAGSITDATQVLYEVLFQSSRIRAVGTTHIKDYDYTAKEIADNRMLVYGWYLIGMDEKAANPLMVFAPTEQSTGATGVSDLRLIRGQMDESVRLPYPATAVQAREDTIYAFTNQYLMTFRLGETKAVTHALPLYVESVLGITQSKKAIVTSGGAVYLLTLP